MVNVGPLYACQRGTERSVFQNHFHLDPLDNGCSGLPGDILEVRLMSCRQRTFLATSPWAPRDLENLEPWQRALGE
jgi:hypothetical protein